MAGADRDNRGWRAARWLVPVLAVAPWLVLLPRFGRLPYNDYYAIAHEILTRIQHPLDPLEWLALRSNEHIVAVPALLYRLNFSLTAGDNRGLSLLALLFLTVQLLLLLRLLPRTLRERPGSDLAARITITALVLSPAVAHSAVMGFSGSIWFTANLVAVAAIAVAAARWRRRASAAATALAIALGVLGAATYSTAFSVWPALVGGSLLARRRRDALVIAGAGLALWALAVAGYERPSHHPTPTVSPLPVAGFALTYLGSPLSRDALVAPLLGATGVIVAIALVVGFVRRGDGAGAAPWCALQVLALGNAVGTAATRVGLGTEAAFESRYVVVASLLWIGVVGMAAVRLHDLPPHVVRGLSVGMMVVVVAFVLARGLPVLSFFLHRASWHPVAELAVVHRIHDDKAIGAFFPYPEQIYANWSFFDALAAIGHVPFDRPHPPLAQPTMSGAAAAPVAGAVTTVEAVGERWVRLEGWRAGCDSGTAVEITDAEGRLVGRGVAALPFGKRLPRPVGATSDGCGWAAYVAADAVHPLQPWLVRGDGRRHPLAPAPPPAP